MPNKLRLVVAGIIRIFSIGANLVFLTYLESSYSQILISDLIIFGTIYITIAHFCVFGQDAIISRFYGGDKNIINIESSICIFFNLFVTFAIILLLFQTTLLPQNFLAHLPISFLFFSSIVFAFFVGEFFRSSGNIIKSSFVMPSGTFGSIFPIFSSIIYMRLFEGSIEEMILLLSSLNIIIPVMLLLVSVNKDSLKAFLVSISKLTLADIKNPFLLGIPIVLTSMSLMIFNNLATYVAYYSLDPSIVIAITYGIQISAIGLGMQNFLSNQNKIFFAQYISKEQKIDLKKLFNNIRMLSVIFSLTFSLSIFLLISLASPIIQGTAIEKYPYVVLSILYIC